MSAELGKALAARSRAFHYHVHARSGETWEDCQLSECFWDRAALSAPAPTVDAAWEDAFTTEAFTEWLRAATVPLHGHPIALRDQAIYVRACVMTRVRAAIAQGGDR